MKWGDLLTLLFMDGALGCLLSSFVVQHIANAHNLSRRRRL